jgi:hypothetical protein
MISAVGKGHGETDAAEPKKKKMDTACMSAVANLFL